MKQSVVTIPELDDELLVEELLDDELLVEDDVLEEALLPEDDALDEELPLEDELVDAPPPPPHPAEIIRHVLTKTRSKRLRRID